MAKLGFLYCFTKAKFVAKCCKIYTNTGAISVLKTHDYKAIAQKHVNRNLRFMLDNYFEISTILSLLPLLVQK